MEQQVTTSDSEWQDRVISANFPFFRIKEEPTTKHSKDNPLNFEEDLEEGLLNYEQKKKKNLKKKY